MIYPRISALATLLAGGALLVEANPIERRDPCVVTDISQVAGAKGCQTITLGPMNITPVQTLDLTGLVPNAKIVLAGDISWQGAQFGGDGKTWLFQTDCKGSGCSFDGKGFTFNGNGQAVWDTFGSNNPGPGKGFKLKPKFLNIGSEGTFSNLNVINAPVQVFSVQNSGQLTMSNIHIDNSKGDAPLVSGGLPAAHNTDCFDVSSTALTIIENSSCINQDDCLAINKAVGVNFLSNKCANGHGISIGSIQTGHSVSNVLIKGNTVTNSENGLRIKTQAGATGATVSDVTYDGNTVTGATAYGVVIRQDYDNGKPTMKPTDGIKISNINFTGGLTTVSTASGAVPAYVLCGSDSCTGAWDWSSLRTTTPPTPGDLTPQKGVPITGYTF